MDDWKVIPLSILYSNGPEPIALIEITPSDDVHELGSVTDDVKLFTNTVTSSLQDEIPSNISALYVVVDDGDTYTERGELDELVIILWWL